jgi:hypothetical protein
MVQCGWRPAEEGGFDYLVQITPERLETLAAGVPYVGQVDPSIPEIRRFYVYAGVSEVPRVGLPAANPADPPPFLAANNATSSQDGLAPFSRPRIQAQRPAESRGGAGGSSPFSRDAGWRSDGQTPDFSANSSATNDSRYGWANTRQDAPSPRFNADGDRRTTPSYSVRDEQYRTAAYDPRSGAARPPDPAPSAPASSQYGQGATTQPAQRVETPVAPVGWQSQAPASPSWSQPSRTPSSTAESEAPARPSLLLTTLGLFASLGGNAFLGWLAWSFFWRYRDAVTDLARSRPLALSAREAA